MFDGLAIVTYTISSILFIFSLASLSQKETSQKGIFFAISGMTIAIIVTILQSQFNNIGYILIAIILGGIIGINISKKIDMTKMPQLIAILHSFVGLTAVIVGLNSYLSIYYNINKTHDIIKLIEIFISIFIGSITFIGSVIAFSKLSGIITTKAYNFKFKKLINFITLIISIILMLIFIHTQYIIVQILSLIFMIHISLIFGLYLIVSIGGADMPVVISMLNSYSGWAAAASGFMLNNDLLIITGALVGSSGAILSYLMCKSMNRSFINVIFGGLQNQKSDNIIENDIEQQYKKISIIETVEILKESNNIIIIPGYGMAVAQAQHAISEVVKKLNFYNIKVRFAIHPVAGRLPGHMNVLLAEANIPYEIILEMDEINKDFSNTDTVLIIGANDTVNPSAQEDKNSPISGMPVLEAWKAKNIIIFKRSMNYGYSGITNPLFYKDNSYMLFGDAKETVNKILKIL
ncbi:NAD(P)(+) transhydrogenase (Re/Si-specific) subunit beta [Enterobacteriaceae endosymbiont of Plateumaris braccata]|uniref:NAD(P)(+) transhydrogenase (Re/Si-specific) subunit beta n=1 Tax=Enterobacteriaceae endosymbiont of Plateumaris braccata TaxID=2675793 RepID=UPI001449D085|nr:NAD(P)(+) transhydrogenase (Re/Si-specific) subunit beta [Enterobacteriaceae endosymbiont of Plateumaris braccata]QJC28046.1 Re/Si-specific NAD(P)(+) transhydrogenase subunit beta [Enterobacteriaceae endosymbiont of Plateumaris braccata]